MEWVETPFYIAYDVPSLSHSTRIFDWLFKNAEKSANNLSVHRARELTEVPMLIRGSHKKPTSGSFAELSGLPIQEAPWVRPI